MKKRLKKKKISGKRKVRIMERKCKILNDALEFQKQRIEEQHRIIRALGSKDGYEFLDTPGLLKIETKTIRPKQYGNYVMLSGEELTNQVIDECKDELVRGIAKGLMEENVVQFIVKDEEDIGPFSQFHTVAAKLNVIPWYETIMNLKAGNMPGE